jgi:hypothetical protein
MRLLLAVPAAAELTEAAPPPAAALTLGMRLLVKLSSEPDAEAMLVSSRLTDAPEARPVAAAAAAVACAAASSSILPPGDV